MSTEENVTKLSNLLKNTDILVLIAHGNEGGLSPKDVLELAFTSKAIFEIVSNNSGVWKHFYESYKLETPSNTTMSSFLNDYKSKM